MDLVEIGALQHRRAVDQLNALHYMHTNMLRVPLCRSCTWTTLVMCRPRSLLCQRRCGPVVLADAAWLVRCTAVAMAGVGHQRLLARLGAIVLHTPPPPSRTAVMEIDRVQQEEERL